MRGSVASVLTRIRSDGRGVDALVNKRRLDHAVSGHIDSLATDIAAFRLRGQLPRPLAPYDLRRPALLRASGGVVVNCRPPAPRPTPMRAWAAYCNSKPRAYDDDDVRQGPGGGPVQFIFHRHLAHYTEMQAVNPHRRAETRSADTPRASLVRPRGCRPSSWLALRAAGSRCWEDVGAGQWRRLFQGDDGLRNQD